MSSPMMQDQKQISPYRGMPVDSLGQSATSIIITGETVQLYYNNAGVLTADAGQAAGTAVLGVLAYDYSLDKIQSCQGKFGDTSLSFTSTAFVTEVFTTPEDFEKADALNWKMRLATLTSGFSNGQYTVDYRSGVIYGKKATITTTLASTTYAIASQSALGSVGPTSALGNTLNTLPFSVYNTVQPTRVNAQGGPFQSDSLGNTLDTLATQIAGEDLTNQVQGVLLKPTASATYSWTLFKNLGSAVTANIKATPGSVKSIYCHNLNASPRYIQIHKTATTPAGGAVPELTFLVPGAGVLAIDGSMLGEDGYYCTTGIAFAFSTAEATYTAGVGAENFTTVMFV